MLTDSLITFFILCLHLLVQAFGHHKTFVHVPLKMTWDEAQKYCRATHTDLASFQNPEEFQAIGNLRWTRYWIGYHRDVNNPNNWIWSDGEEVKFESWLPNEPNNLCEKCGVTNNGYWIDVPCVAKYESLCYEDDLIFVEEKKTWEEALEHCRALQTYPPSNGDHLCDLPHMHTGTASLYVKDLIQNAQTQEVWIGLRYLAGHWFWVDGFPLNEELEQYLPECPAPLINCGTISKTGGPFKLRDCSERRNFFCLLKD